MKQAITLLAICLTTISFGQERHNRVGLNRFIPDNVSAGMKIQQNTYFPSLVLNSTDATTSTIHGSNVFGGGGGFYFRYDLKEHFAIQPEINFQFMSGDVNSTHVFQPDTMLTVTKDGYTSYQSLNVEIPIYAKWRWELIATRKGHLKANSAFSLFIGPRAIITPYSKQQVGRSTYSVLYDQPSRLVETDLSDADPKYSPFAGMGIAAGADFELWNGFIVHASFYRGILTESKKINGFKAYDNRVEVGIGIRFK